MENLTCNYHPETPASWRCQGCGSGLCEACAVHRQDKPSGVEKQFHLCPRCNRTLLWLGCQVVPFWKRIPGFFLYPFWLQPLVLNILLCGLSLVVTGTSLISLLIRIAVWGVWLKYSFASLKATATGNLKPPPVSTKTISDDFLMVFQQVILFVLLGAVIGWVFTVFGMIPGVLCASLIMLLMPAMIILLVSTGSILQALNPVTVFGLPLRIGPGYLTMYLFLILLGCGPAALFIIAGPYIPAAVLSFLMVFSQNYYTLISYNLMGYLLLQYHRQIGYKVAYEDAVQDKGAGPEAPEAAFLAGEVEIHIRDGAYEKALDLLENEIRSHPDPPLDILDRYYRLLKHLNRPIDQLVHGQAYIRRLIAAEDKTRACEIYMDCSRVDKRFAPDPRALARLGGWLKSRGYHREAIRAYSAFTKLYSSHAMMPVVCFRAAEIFNDHFGQKQKAGALLKGIVKKYPNHDIIPFIRNYMKRIRV